jgi:hypothetical protein
MPYSSPPSLVPDLASFLQHRQHLIAPIAQRLRLVHAIALHCQHLSGTCLLPFQEAGGITEEVLVHTYDFFVQMVEYLPMSCMVPPGSR